MLCTSWVLAWGLRPVLAELNWTMELLTQRGFFFALLFLRYETLLPHHILCFQLVPVLDPQSSTVCGIFGLLLCFASKKKSPSRQMVDATCLLLNSLSLVQIAQPQHLGKKRVWTIRNNESREQNMLVGQDCAGWP